MRPSFTFLILLFLVTDLNIYGQCGTDPTSGTTTISGASDFPNSYFEMTTSLAVGATSFTLGTIDSRGNGATLSAGNLVLFIQMQGAEINNANTNAYGNNTTSGSGYLDNSNLTAGHYEYATVLSNVAGLVTLTSGLIRAYSHQNFAAPNTPRRRYQIIRVNREYNLSVTGTATAPEWNGATGGVVVLDAANVMTISGTVDVNAKGFRGGGGRNFTGASNATLATSDYRFGSLQNNTGNGTGGAKGEGIAGTPVYLFTNGATSTVNATGNLEGYVGGAMGRGAPGNAGGGATDGAPNANTNNSGGGGGANGGAGGKGGNSWSNNLAIGGEGGSAFAQRGMSRMVMGGGGGAGSGNNSSGFEYQLSGGVGGGIIILRAASFAGSGLLTANGGAAPGIPASAAGRTDGVGGGGAGGTIAAVTRTNTTVGLNSMRASAIGGRGANTEVHFNHGPGGGGGGGVIITNGTFQQTLLTGGNNGLTKSGTENGPIDNAFGATSGATGVLVNLPTAPVFVNASNSPTGACGVLPVILEAFNASLSGASTMLDWTVAQAVNFAGFEVEYSTNGSEFISVGQIDFKPSQNKYQFVHSGNAAEISYYRLKLKDKDGAFSYSKTIALRHSVAAKNLVLYPQPARSFTTVQVSAINRQQVQVQLINANGARVAQKLVQLGAGNNVFLFDNLEKLSQGFYTLRMTIDGKPQQAKLIISN